MEGVVKKSTEALLIIVTFVIPILQSLLELLTQQSSYSTKTTVIVERPSLMHDFSDSEGLGTEVNLIVETSNSLV